MRAGSAREFRSGGHQVNRWFGDERGGVLSEVSFGVSVFVILAISGLWIVSQLEGVSLHVLLQQLRNGN
jgi:hypothetical protein